MPTRRRRRQPASSDSHRVDVRNLFAASAVVLLLALSACRTTPFSGRQQLVLMPEEQEIALGAQAYQEVLKGEPLSTNREATAMVQRVGQRIAAVAGRPDYQWEFNLVASSSQNAFALPGGKVAVYEGVLPVCQHEAGLAVVMSHEIAHAIARHGGERMSQETAVSGVRGVLDMVTKDRMSEADHQTLMSVYGVSTRYGAILPYSREHESEADSIGLMLMARAGYDPSEAPAFWERFAAMSGPKAPELLSTHPSDVRRAAELRALVPQALKYYEGSPQKFGLGEALVMMAAAPVASPVNTVAPVMSPVATAATNWENPFDTPSMPTDSAVINVPQVEVIEQASFQEPVVIDRPVTDHHVIKADGWIPVTGKASVSSP